MDPSNVTDGELRQVNTKLANLGFINPRLSGSYSIHRESEEALRDISKMLNKSEPRSSYGAILLIDEYVRSKDKIKESPKLPPKTPDKVVQSSQSDSRINTQSSRPKIPPKTLTSKRGKASAPNYEPIKCYLQNLNTKEITRFDLESPESISDNSSADFTNVSTMGRSHPWRSYKGGGGRSISFELTLYDDYCREGLPKTIQNFRNLCYPYYSGNRVLSPKCKLVLGGMVNISAVMTRVGVTWEKPYKDNIYRKARLSLSFEEVVDTTKSQGYLDT